MSIVTDDFDSHGDFRNDTKAPHREHVEHRSQVLATEILEELWRKLAKRRCESKRSQGDIGRELRPPIHQGTVSKIENGESNPAWKTVVDLCEVLGTSLPEVILEMYAERISETECKSLELLGGQIQLMVKRDDAMKAKAKSKVENPYKVPAGRSPRI